MHNDYQLILYERVKYMGLCMQIQIIFYIEFGNLEHNCTQIILLHI